MRIAIMAVMKRQSTNNLSTNKELSNSKGFMIPPMKNTLNLNFFFEKRFINIFAAKTSSAFIMRDRRIRRLRDHSVISVRLIGKWLFVSLLSISFAISPYGKVLK